MRAGSRSFETKSLSMKKVALAFLIADALGMYAVQSQLSQGVPADAGAGDQFASTELARPISETARAAVPYVGLPPSTAAGAVGQLTSAQRQVRLAIHEPAPVPAVRRAPLTPPPFLSRLQRPTEVHAAARPFEAAFDMPEPLDPPVQAGPDAPSFMEPSAPLGDIAINAITAPSGNAAVETGAGDSVAEMPGEVPVSPELPALESGVSSPAPAAIDVGLPTAEVVSSPEAATPAG